MSAPEPHDPVADVSAESVAGVRSGWSALVVSTVARSLVGCAVSLVLWSVLPMVIGWSATVTLTGSMQPAISPGDVVVTAPAHPADVVPGAIVVVADPDRPGAQRLHRVVQVADDGLIWTRGDANAGEDSSPVQQADVRGVARLVLPSIGLPVVWAHDGATGTLALAGLVGLLVGAATVLWRPPPGAAPTWLGRGGWTTADRAPRGRGGRTTADRLHRFGVPALLVAVIAVGGSLVAPGPAAGTAYAGYTARTSNPDNLLGVNPYWDCSTAASAASAAQHYPLTDLTGTSATNDGTGGTGPGSYAGSYTLGATGPRCTSTGTEAAVTLGANGAVLSGGTAQTAPTTATVQVWFRTTAAGGRLAGFGNSQTGSSTAYDRGLYVRTDGRVGMGVVSGFSGSTPIPAVVTSPKSYNDGAWHLATGTFGDGSVRLYLDGVQVGSVAGGAAWSYQGWWRWGWDTLTGVSAAPADPSFIGSLAHAAVFSRVLTAAEVSAQYGAGT